MTKQFTYGPESSDAPPLPPPEGPLTEIVTRTIVRRASDHRDRSMLEQAIRTISDRTEDPLTNLDLQLALDLCYELHYQSFRGVDPAWEWDPQLLEIRFRMESVFLGSLADAISKLPDLKTGNLADQLRAVEAPDPVPQFARFVEHDCDLAQVRELLIHRSAERLKRTDAFLWSIPRTRGPARDALIAIAEDERPRRDLLAGSMQALGLDGRIGAYRDLLPASTLGMLNLSSLFGLRRQGRGAMAGRLAMQMILGARDDRACARAMGRLGLGREAAAFCEDSAAASRALERVAVEDLAGRLATEEPRLTESIIFGAQALLVTEVGCAEWMLDHWRSGSSSLLTESVGLDGSGDG